MPGTRRWRFTPPTQSVEAGQAHRRDRVTKIKQALIGRVGRVSRQGAVLVSGRAVTYGDRALPEAWADGCRASGPLAADKGRAQRGSPDDVSDVLSADLGWPPGGCVGTGWVPLIESARARRPAGE